MKELLKTTDTYRVDTEDEALQLIETMRENGVNNGYTVTKSSYALKTKKSKGETIDSWVVCVVERTFGE